jgi:polar amino acid transport system substrate-binding protein
MQVGYAPFQMTGQQGTVIGFDVDAAGLTSEALGVGLRIVGQEWDELIPSLLEGKTDIVMSGMTRTPERNIRVVFCDPVVETGRMFLVHKKNAAKFEHIKDLNAAGVFVASGAKGLGTFPIGSLLPKAGHREFRHAADALNEVIEGRAHAYIDEEFAVRMACARRPDKLIGRFTPLTYEAVAWAISPGDCHWLNWLNNFIRGVEKDGRLEDLKRKWLRDYYLDMGSSAK